MLDLVLSKEQIHELAVGFRDEILLYVKEQAEEQNEGLGINAERETVSVDCALTGGEDNGNACLS